MSPADPRPLRLRPAWLPVPLAALLLLTGSACPERNASPPAPPAPCTQVGQRCEFSPGKLGTCVKRDDCRGDNCFICQSQH